MVSQVYYYPKLLVWEAIYENDEGSWSVKTPEQRYDDIMRWLDRQLVTIGE